jgi:hypothetical protein
MHRGYGFNNLNYLGEDKERHLLCWYTREEGHSLIASSSLENLLSLYRNILKRHSDAEVRGYWVGSFIGVPEHLKELWEKAVYKNAFDSFIKEVANLVIEHKEVHGEFPPNVTPCSEYLFKYRDDDLDDDKEENEYLLKHHFDCVNCDGLRFIAIDGMNYEELFEAKNDFFN